MADDDETCDLGWSIAMVGRGYAQLVEPVFGGFPRGARGYQLLHTVIHKEIRSQLALAEYLGLDPTVIPYVIDDLVTAGYVERTNDPADRRVRKIVATPEGRRLFASLSSAVREAEAAFLADLAPEAQRAFRSGLSALARRSRRATT